MAVWQSGGLLLLLSVVHSGQDQTPILITSILSLSGHVADHEARAHLPGATVVVLEARQATQAEVAGNCHFYLCAGLCHLQISYLGCQP